MLTHCVSSLLKSRYGSASNYLVSKILVDKCVATITNCFTYNLILEEGKEVMGGGEMRGRKEGETEEEK